ncbi:phage tail tape measure protein [Flavobacterium sp.]|uniref:phage tail tape measure protein n=1 Tax=Flavobacterium sp. TaxID=239 RepID=UPI00122BD19F|nr:phage tail tape measure protein [Flavobacterium sp.]RZJ71066.1 MAG: hypothetical protein EOO49_11475 [Flavobacterium sp.]
MAAPKVTRELSIYVNDREVVNSLSGINREITKVNNEIKNLNKNSSTYDSDLKKLKGTLGDLKEKQSEFKEELYETKEAIEQTGDEMSAFGDSWSKIIGGFASGDLKLAQAGISSIGSSLGAATRAGLAFIATPIGAAIAILAGIALVTKEWVNYNNEVYKTNKLVAAITKESGENLDIIRVKASSLAETFDQELNTVLESARALVNEFGIEYSEALDIIQDGLIKGGAASDEFLASIKEYATFFAAAGYSVEEFQNLLNTGIDIGIYADKLPDAIKEFGLSVREETKASRDALVNAFGKEFTDKLFAGIKDGSITVKQALQLVADEAERVGLNSQQAQQLTADLFRGAGEDAGGALKIFEAVRKSIQNQTRDLTEVEKATKQLADSELALAEAQDRALKSDGFLKWKTTIVSVFNEVKSGFYDMVAEVTDGSGLLNALIPLTGLFTKSAVEERIKQQSESKAIANYAEDSKKAFEVYIAARRKSLGDLFDFEETRMKYLESLRQSYANLKKKADPTEMDLKIAKRYEAAIKAIEKYAETAQTTASSTKKTTEELMAAAIEGLERRKARLDALGKDTYSIEIQILQTKMSFYKKGTAEYEKYENELLKLQREYRDKKAKERAEEAKKQAEIQQALLTAQIRVAKALIDYEISKNLAAFSDGKELTKEIIGQEIERQNTLAELRQDELIRIRETNLQKANDTAKSEEELSALKKAIDLEYLTSKQNLEDKIAAEILKIREKLSDQLIKKEEKLAKKEAERIQAEADIRIAEASSKREQEEIRKEAELEKDIARFQKLRDQGVITEDQLLRYKKAAATELRKFKQEQAFIEANSVLGTLNDVASAASSLFGQSKGIASAQAVINGALGITSVLSKTYTSNGFIDAALKAVQIAVVTATTFANVAKINSQSAPSTPKFKTTSTSGYFFGGATGEHPALGYDQYGPITGVVHKREWVMPEIMTTNPRYAKTLTWLESERKGLIRGRGFFNGGETTTGTVPTFQPTSTDPNLEMLIALKTLNNLLARGIDARAVIGYSEAQEIQKLNDETAASAANGILS